MTAPDPVAVTVQVPVSGSGETIEVTVTLSARRTAFDLGGDGYLPGQVPEPEPPPADAEPVRPSAVFGASGTIRGVAPPRE